MEVLVRNAEGNVSSKDREYAAKKLGSLDRFFHAAQRVEMVHREEKLGRHRVEITVFADGYAIRGVETDVDIPTAIDRVREKLENRLRRLKTRLVRSHRGRGQAPPEGLLALPDEPELEPEDTLLAETKQLHLKPMSVEEAALQMEMVGHEFFLFLEATSQHPCVIYKRKDGRYGMLEAAR